MCFFQDLNLDVLGFLPYPLPGPVRCFPCRQGFGFVAFKEARQKDESEVFVAPQRGYPWRNCYMTLGYNRYWLYIEGMFSTQLNRYSISHALARILR